MSGAGDTPGLVNHWFLYMLDIMLTSLHSMLSGWTRRAATRNRVETFAFSPFRGLV